MSNIPEFKFDFDAVDGQPFEEATVSLFKQLQDHYNKHIKPAPILFGGKSVGRPFAQEYPSTATEAAAIAPKPIVSGDIVRMAEGWEIKEGKELGLKDGQVLTGVTVDGVEVFDFLKNYSPEDQIVTGDSAKYDLGRAK